MAKETRLGGWRQAAAALAGRRIDAFGAEPKQFPLNRVPAVRLALQEFLTHEAVGLLVCSAACGADLLALDVALGLGIRCRVVLPFDPESFRRTSVVDRPGDWGLLYDRIVATVSTAGDLVVLDGKEGEESSYRLANRVIIREVIAAAAEQSLVVLVWEGHARKRGDATANLRHLAVKAGMSERMISTI